MKKVLSYVMALCFMAAPVVSYAGGGGEMPAPPQVKHEEVFTPEPAPGGFAEEFRERKYLGNSTYKYFAEFTNGLSEKYKKEGFILVKYNELTPEEVKLLDWTSDVPMPQPFEREDVVTSFVTTGTHTYYIYLWYGGIGTWKVFVLRKQGT